MANMNQNGQSGVSFGTGAMIPTLGEMTQQEVESGMQPLVNDAAVAQKTTTSAQSKYVRVWKGNLSAPRQGQPIFLTKLECYRSSSASEALTTNWPPEIQIVRLVPHKHMNIFKQYVRKEELLVFRAMNPHAFLGQLKKKKQCAVIQFPSQTMLLCVSNKACRLIGMMFPRDMIKPQLLSQQQPQMQQQHQLMVSQGQVSSQGSSNTGGGNFMS